MISISVLVITIVYGVSRCNAVDCDLNTGKDWYYNNSLNNGPKTWGGDCNKGIKQSPIDIKTSAVVKISHSKGLQLKNYEKPFSKVIILNTGRTVQIEPNDGTQRSIQSFGGSFNLKAIFISWGENKTDGNGKKISTPGSGHTIDGKRYAMELNLVHEKGNTLSGNLAKDKAQKVIISVLLDYNDNASNQFIKAIQYPIKKYIREKNKYSGDLKKDYNATIDLSKLVPNGHSYYQYNGSEPVPPCTENVFWYVIRGTSAVANKEIVLFETSLYSVEEEKVDDVGDQFDNTLGPDPERECFIVDNFRPTQLLYKRKVASG